ncbi:MAG TPA: threonine/serine dehydratase [Vicinamibacterales bacterium]|jgi:threonine dehydratase
MDLDLSVTRIEEAARTVDPVFLNSPQYADESLNAAVTRNVVVKVETANPLRSFKGRGADFFMGRVDPRSTVVCSSTGNFGQALAYAGRRRGIAVKVFVPENINPVKLDRMRAFGASVTLVGIDSAASEAAARDYIAGKEGCVYVEDGKEPAIAEGAGTIGVELMQAGPFDAVVIPVGDGALVAGIACWMKAYAPQTRIIGVCASGAPCIALSWRARKPVSTERSDTIAEGIEVRVPVPESVVRLVALVDDMVLVDDSDLLDAMQLSVRTLGLLLEPSAAAGLAAIRVHNIPGNRLATVLTGSNLRPEHLRGLST